MHALVPNAQKTWPHLPTWWWLVSLIPPPPTTPININNRISSMDNRISPSMAPLPRLVSLWVFWLGAPVVKRWKGDCKLSSN